MGEGEFRIFSTVILNPFLSLFLGKIFPGVCSETSSYLDVAAVLVIPFTPFLNCTVSSFLFYFFVFMELFSPVSSLERRHNK